MHRYDYNGDVKYIKDYAEIRNAWQSVRSRISFMTVATYADIIYRYRNGT